MTYGETMEWGARQYRDVLDALAAVDLDGEFIQTGGMCAALQVTLDGGYYLVFTDHENTLSWSRVEHEGWYVGLAGWSSVASFALAARVAGNRLRVVPDFSFVGLVVLATTRAARHRVGLLVFSGDLL